MEDIKFIAVGSDTILPTKGHKTDAGWDLYANIYVGIHPRGSKDQYINKYIYQEPIDRMVVPTGVFINWPEDVNGTLHAEIRPRSSLASNGIQVSCGVIDYGYTGEIKVVMYNHTDEFFDFSVGSKIAQLVFYYYPFDFSMDRVQKESKRGSKGFGSTDN